MAISLDEYKKQYNLAENKKTPSSQPISLDEFKSKYSNETQQTSSEREERIQKGLPVSTEARFERTGKAKPSFGGVIAREVAKIPTRLASTATSGFRETPTTPIKSDYFGDIRPYGTAVYEGGLSAGQKFKKGDVKGGIKDYTKGLASSTAEGIGAGLEAASYAVAPGALSTFRAGGAGLARKALQSGITEAGAGAMYGIGSEAQEEDPSIKGLGRSAIQGAGAGFAGGLVGIPAGQLLSKATRTVFPDLLSKTTKGAVESSAVRNVKDRLDKAFRSTESVKNVYEAVSKKTDVLETSAKYGLIPEFDFDTKKVDVSRINDTINKNISNIYREQLDYLKKSGYEGSRIDDMIEDVYDITRDTQDILQRGTLDKIRTQSIKQLEEYRKIYGDIIDPEKLFLIRQRMNKDSRAFNNLGEFTKSDTAKVIGDVMRKNLDDLGDGVITESNREVGRLLDTQKVFDKLGGKTLGKGVMQQNFFRLIGAMATTNSQFMFGPLLGALGGDALLSALRMRAFGSGLDRRIIKQLVEQPEVINRLRKEGLKSENEKFLREIIKKQGDQVKRLEAAPAGAIEVRSKVVKKEPIPMTQKAQSTIDADEIARIQAQLNEVRSLEQLAREITNEIDDYVPEEVTQDVAKSLQEDILQLETQLSVSESIVANSPAKQLMKYTNKRTGGRKGAFKAKGDDIVTELGFDDSEQAREAIDGYVSLKESTKEMKKTLKSLKDKFKKITK